MPVDLESTSVCSEAAQTSTETPTSFEPDEADETVPLRSIGVVSHPAMTAARSANPRTILKRARLRPDPTTAAMFIFPSIYPNGSATR